MSDYQLYQDLAEWWPVISPPEHYEQEARRLAAIFTAGPQPARHVLDLGCGGGHVAVHLKDQLELTLVDLSGQMLAVSRELNPECKHVLADMRTVRLGRQFDGVLVHDAVDYMTAEDELAQVIGTAFAHCRPGGIAVFVPDYTAETFRAASGRGGGSDWSGRQASFRERDHDPDPDDGWIQADYEFRLQDADGSVRMVHESHRLGAFSEKVWLRLLEGAGFTAEHRPRAVRGAMFIARR